MKCQRCGEREANFFYSSEINGRRTERCLCSECAREEGLAEAFAPMSCSMLGGMFGGLMNEFFAPARPLMSGFGLFGPERGSIMRTFPSVSFEYAEPETEAEESESRIPTDAGADIRLRREREALRQQLQSAIQDENYEKAAELRDRLKRLEG